MKKGVKILSWFMAIFLIAFLSYFVIRGNYEFSGYGVVAGLAFFVLIWANEYYDLPLASLWLFAIWVILHLLGGSVYLGGTRLYDIVMINLYNGASVSPEFVILKFDQFVHAYCYFAFSIVIYFLMKKHMKPKQNKALIVFTILAALGVGLINEIIEFSMVIFADAGNMVGGYYNTALDLVFNFIGAVIGTLFARRFE